MRKGSYETRRLSSSSTTGISSSLISGRKVFRFASSGVNSASHGVFCLHLYAALRRGLLSQSSSYGTPHTSAIAICTGFDVALRRMTIDISSGVTPRYSAKATKVRNPLIANKILINWGLFSFFSLLNLVSLIMVRMVTQVRYSVKGKLRRCGL